MKVGTGRSGSEKNDSVLMLASNEQCRKQPTFLNILATLIGRDFGVVVNSLCGGYFG